MKSLLRSSLLSSLRPRYQRTKKSGRCGVVNHRWQGRSPPEVKVACIWLSHCHVCFFFHASSLSL